MGCVMCTPLDDVCNMTLWSRRRRTVELTEFPQASHHGYHGYQKFIYLPSIREELLPVNEEHEGLDYGTS